MTEMGAFEWGIVGLAVFVIFSIVIIGIMYYRARSEMSKANAVEIFPQRRPYDNLGGASIRSSHHLAPVLSTRFSSRAPPLQNSGARSPNRSNLNGSSGKFRISPFEDHSEGTAASLNALPSIPLANSDAEKMASLLQMRAMCEDGFGHRDAKNKFSVEGKKNSSAPFREPKRNNYRNRHDAKTPVPFGGGKSAKASRLFSGLDDDEADDLLVELDEAVLNQQEYDGFGVDRDAGKCMFDNQSFDDFDLNTTIFDDCDDASDYNESDRDFFASDDDRSRTPTPTTLI